MMMRTFIRDSYLNLKSHSKCPIWKHRNQTKLRFIGTKMKCQLSAYFNLWLKLISYCMTINAKDDIERNTVSNIVKMWRDVFIYLFLRIRTSNKDDSQQPIYSKKIPMCFESMSTYAYEWVFIRVRCAYILFQHNFYVYVMRMYTNEQTNKPIE